MRTHIALALAGALMLGPVLSQVLPQQAWAQQGAPAPAPDYGPSISNEQAKAWLQRLVDEGVLEKQKKPAGYIVKQKRLFE